MRGGVVTDHRWSVGVVTEDGWYTHGDAMAGGACRVSWCFLAAGQYKYTMPATATRCTRSGTAITHTRLVNSGDIVVCDAAVTFLTLLSHDAI